jgi:hypothetical protein
LLLGCQCFRRQCCQSLAHTCGADGPGTQAEDVLAVMIERLTSGIEA